MARRARPHVAALPWWAWVLLGIAAAGVLHWIATVPVPLDVPLAFIKTLATFFQFGLPLLCAMAALISYVESRRSPPPPEDATRLEPTVGRQAAVDTSRWSLELLGALEWRRFELVAASYFESLGFQARQCDIGPDGGVDIRLYPGAGDRPALLVQCKAWRTQAVGVKTVRELYGVMAADGVQEGALVASGAFTEEAKRFAKDKPLHLIDGEDLVHKLRQLPVDRSQALLKRATEGDFTTPTCPSCGERMVMRVAGGSGRAFWGCPTFPRCRAVIQA